MEDASVHIRKFRLEDIREILSIEEGASPKSVYSKETFLHFAVTSPDTFHVVEVDRKVAGYIIFDAKGHIYSIVIHPDHRRTGFGSMLVMNALTQANKAVWIEVRSRNIGAIKFYRNLGMRIVGKIPGYYGTDDALVMAMPVCIDQHPRI